MKLAGSWQVVSGFGGLTLVKRADLLVGRMNVE